MQVDFKSWNKPSWFLGIKSKLPLKVLLKIENWFWDETIFYLPSFWCFASKITEGEEIEDKTAISSRFWKKRSFEAKTAISSHFWKRASFPLIRVEKKTPSFCRKAFLKIIHVSMWKKETHVVKCKSKDWFCFFEENIRIQGKIHENSDVKLTQTTLADATKDTFVLSYK